MANHDEASPQLYARTAGVLYLIIIVFGIFSEVFIRSNLIAYGDPAATAANVTASMGLFRFGFFADSAMFLSDVALAVLLYVLLRPVSKVLALVATAFRLVQTAVLALNLLNYHAAALLLGGGGYAEALGPQQLNAMSYFFLDLHGHGYDLGLLLFGLHCALLGYLVFRSGYLPRALGVLMIAAAATYLTGSYTRFLFPQHMAAIAPIYIVAFVSELAFCLWLLVKGVNVEIWKRKAGVT
jgi:hypothetical protein